MVIAESSHILFNRLALYAAVYLIWDAYQDLKKDNSDKRALVRLGIGVITFIVDYVFLKSWGVNLLGG